MKIQKRGSVEGRVTSRTFLSWYYLGALPYVLDVGRHRMGANGAMYYALHDRGLGNLSGLHIFLPKREMQEKFHRL